MSRKVKPRQIITPRGVTDLAETDEKLTYWKQILPEAAIQYTDEAGATRTIQFDKAYHADCINSFSNRAIDQVCFQVADAANRHGHDFSPERQRAEVLDMATLDSLPPDVQEKVGHRPGLYAKMKFFSKAAAKSVRENPRLGVSARVRENFTRADGGFVKRAVIHVLGTIDPKVTGMAAWQGADFSYDSHDNVLNLSNAEYEGDSMSKKSGAGAGTIPTDEQIDAMTDAELDAFLAQGRADIEAENDTEDPDDEDDSDDEDTDDDTEDAETVLTTTGASLSNAATRAINLANAQAAQANARAQRALDANAERNWLDYRGRMVGLGVAPADLDLCEPILNRAEGMTVNLSNEGRPDVDVVTIVRGLLDKLQGTIDMSNEAGHTGALDLSNADDPDNAVLAQWGDEYGN